MKKISIHHEPLRTYTSVKEAFPESFKSKTFVKLYTKEVSRLKLIHQINAIRKEHKLTQKTLAERTNMPQSVIARIESGRHDFSLVTLHRIAKAFNKQVALV